MDPMFGVHFAGPTSLQDCRNSKFVIFHFQEKHSKVYKFRKLNNISQNNKTYRFDYVSNVSYSCY